MRAPLCRGRSPRECAPCGSVSAGADACPTRQARPLPGRLDARLRGAGSNAECVWYDGSMSGPAAVTGRAAGWLAIAGALALAGCFAHAPQGYTCPARGGPTWRELTSEHFVVDTDRQSGGARALVEEL